MKRTLLAVAAALSVLAPLATTTASAQSQRISCQRQCDGNPQCIRACNDLIQSPKQKIKLPPTDIPEPEDKPVPKWIGNAFDGGLGGGGGGGGGGGAR